MLPCHLRVKYLNVYEVEMRTKCTFPVLHIFSSYKILEILGPHKSRSILTASRTSKYIYLTTCLFTLQVQFRFFFSQLYLTYHSNLGYFVLSSFRRYEGRKDVFRWKPAMPALLSTLSGKLAWWYTKIPITLFLNCFCSETTR